MKLQLEVQKLKLQPYYNVECCRTKEVTIAHTSKISN